MILIQAHRFKYKLLNNGIMMMSPVKQERWDEVSREKTNLTGGDVELLRNTLETLNQNIPENYILPRALQVSDTVIESMGTR